jgi:hypothetical protein
MNPILPIDKLTFWLFIAFLPIWLVWELVLIKMRGANPSVDLISMVARDRGYQFTAMVFAWGSLAAHYWVNWRHLPWESPIPAIMFWVLMLAACVWDYFLWHTPYSTLPFWMRVVRWPGTMLFLGFLNGVFLFPQKGPPSQPF